MLSGRILIYFFCLHLLDISLSIQTSAFENLSTYMVSFVCNEVKATQARLPLPLLFGALQGDAGSHLRGSTPSTEPLFLGHHPDSSPAPSRPPWLTTP